MPIRRLKYFGNDDHLVLEADIARAEQSNSKKAAVFFASKAETLGQLRGRLRLARVLPGVYFEHRLWCERRLELLDAIESCLPVGPLIVRSSSVSEDRLNCSGAGRFRSQLVDRRTDLPTTIDAVFRSMSSGGADSWNEQVLVQPFVKDVRATGVITTRVLDNGAPYYSISFDVDAYKTDGVTNGDRAVDLYVVWRGLAPAEIDPKLRGLIACARELENVVGERDLDIEFTTHLDGTFTILQVRPISLLARSRWSAMVVSETNSAIEEAHHQYQQLGRAREWLRSNGPALSDMADWNPAEIIGTKPRPLASSLYRHLIMRRTWAEARFTMGYRDLRARELMHEVGGRPYVDVEASLLSFVPATAGNDLANRVVTQWLTELCEAPERHDKLEFEVAITCYDFTANSWFRRGFSNPMTRGESTRYEGGLQDLTRTALDGIEGGLSKAMRNVAELEQHQLLRDPLDMKPTLASIFVLLEECIRGGTLPFAIIARHAFIAEALVRSLVKRDALTAARLDALRASTQTVTHQFLTDATSVEMAPSDLAIRYGHLRPGTYDIRSPRYTERALDVVIDFPRCQRSQPSEFAWKGAEERAINVLLRESKLGNSPLGLLRYFRLAVAAREWAKFVFTRHLSAILELLSSWGGSLGLSREDLSFATIDDLMVHRSCDEQRSISANIEKRRQGYRARANLLLGDLILSEADVAMPRIMRGTPNFVGRERVEGPVRFLAAADQDAAGLRGAVVCIENADPGFDWIFLHDIAALVTRFGGANSHMAIRCAELGIPAALGCGDLFATLRHAHRIQLDCSARTVHSSDVQIDGQHPRAR